MKRQDQIKYIIENYPDKSASEIAEFLGLKKHTVYNIAFYYGIKKSEDWKKRDREYRIKLLTATGADHRFKKAHVPFNKGKKLDSHVIEKIKKTFFKKGNTPLNIKYDGHERMSKDGYILIRIKKGKYIPKHQHIFRQTHGEIPAGHVVIFKDKNKLNFDINNLVLISRSGLMKRNTIHRYPDEIKECIKIISKIKKRINEKQD